MPVESNKGCSRIKPTWFNEAHPSIGRQSRNGCVELRPLFAAVGRKLQIAVICTHPYNIFILRALCYRIDSAMIFGSRVVYGQTTGLKLSLLGRIIRCEIGGNTAPTIAHVFGHKQVLGSKVHALRFIGTDMNRRIPVEAIFFFPSLRIGRNGLRLPGR